MDYSYFYSNKNQNKNIEKNFNLCQKHNKQYKSFLDIIDSIKNPLNKYIKDIDYKEFGITKDYDFTKSTNFRDYITKSDEIIKYIPINIENDIEDKKNFSKRKR